MSKLMIVWQYKLRTRKQKLAQNFDIKSAERITLKIRIRNFGIFAKF